MGANRKGRDPIPERFKTVEEFEDFWSRHSLADYDDIQRDVEFNIKLAQDEIVTLKPTLVRELHKRAHQRKMTVAELVNTLLEEKLSEAA